ncbi:MAG TPA: response regulator transcription factor [Patescibacteria group bacterium]|nr:response regulator transcription factor [Patescibacteria group bacterium]
MVILIIEDNKEQSELIKTVLQEENYVVDTALDGKQALERVEVRDYDLLIVDLDLPFVTGQEIIKRVRELEISVPILVLTANDQLSSVVDVLDNGADDYVTKPFAVTELVARVRALLRRPKQVLSNTFTIGGVEVMYGTHEVLINGVRIKLTKNEFRLLDFLLRKADRVCTRSMIQEHVWGYNKEHQSNLIEVVMYNLRRKLRKANADFIETVQNIGYRIKSDKL